MTVFTLSRNLYLDSFYVVVNGSSVSTKFHDILMGDDEETMQLVPVN